MDTVRYLLVLFTLFRIHNSQSSPVVETSLGPIQGSTLTSQKDNEFFAFRGIPYARAPVGSLRFAPPETVDPWTSPLKATRDSLVCPQPGLTVFMTENCLVLNVFTRNLTARAPVIVYIHGGANVLGSGHSLYEAGPHYLLDHEVVLVAFNYRLGALGFLSTQSAEAPGNLGYLDQVMALHWVQQHIDKFGGDPELVTIFGMSAGAMAVTLHMASPLSKGLFHRAIAMSGSATNHFHIDNVAWTRKLAREVSCPMYTTKNVLNCLRNVSWKTIASVCTNWENYGFTNMKWNYEIDGHFLLDHPTQVFRNGHYNKVPLMTGFSKNELDFSVDHLINNAGMLNDIFENFHKYAPELFLYRDAGDNTELTSEQLQEFYLAQVTSLNRSNIEKLGEIFSDSIIGHGVHRLVQLITQHEQNVYYYRTDYVGARSMYLDNDGRPRGVGHADELQYIMPGLWYGTQFNENHTDVFMMERLTKWFVTFAKYGVPGLANDTDYKWLPSSKKNIQVLYNDREPHMGGAAYAERYALWDALFPLNEEGPAQTFANYLRQLWPLHRYP